MGVKLGRWREPIEKSSLVSSVIRAVGKRRPLGKLMKVAVCSPDRPLEARELLLAADNDAHGLVVVGQVVPLINNLNV